MNKEKSTALEERVVDEVVASFPDRTGNLLGILEELQKRHPHRYLPAQVLERVAEKAGVSPAQVLSVATFYSFFNLQPQGRHTIMVCRGTACHTRDSRQLLDTVNAMVQRPAEDRSEAYTTPDYKLTVRTVACFGQCALAPVVAVDDRIYGHVTDLKLRKIVQSVLEQESDHEDSRS
jgi:NADH-quinone oxidoreductase subunit E